MTLIHFIPLLWAGLFMPVETIESEKPFVLVELFTSEGCSSCPSADRLLSEIVDAKYEDVNVIGLSFHVHYWDYIGWKDPYADPRFSQRQRTYADKLRSYQVYTPQMVVNGRYEFVGSNRAKWSSLLGSLRKEKPNYAFDVSALDRQTDQINFSIKADQDTPLLVNVALVERNLSQQVTRGENRGRKLSHDNVVRSFVQKNFSGGEMNLSIDVPSDLKIKNSSLVVYFQETGSYKILAAIQREI